MDRAIIYPGQVPLETDLLRTNLYAMIGLGRLALDVVGSSTVVSGLACTPTSPASMVVNMGAGAIYALQNIDNSAYSSIAADTADQIVKQGVLKTSDALSLTLAAPTTAGTSVIYLIEAAFSETDTGSTVLPFYNATTPSVPYSGPSGTGASSNTRRAAQVNVLAKAGVAASSPTAPAPDTGFVPLYYVTIAYGQTTITSGNITVAGGAPFLTTNLGNLATTLTGYLLSSTAAATYLTQSAAASTYLTQANAASTYAPKASPGLTGVPTAPTAAVGTNTTQIATTAAVLAAMLGSPSQAWTDVTSSRVSGTNYTNTTGRPIEVIVCFYDTSNLAPTVTVVVGGVTIINALQYDYGTNDNTMNAAFVVPAGATYSVTCSVSGALGQWCELR